MKKTGIPVWVKPAILIFVILLALILIMGYIWKSLCASDYFRIKDIIGTQANIKDLSYLKGHNIFTIDLKKESAYLLDLYPSYSSVRLVRVLPDRLFVDFIKRRPLALIKLYRYFAVDQEGVIFTRPPEAEEFDLPIILGLETKIFGPKPGKRYNIKELNAALEITKEIKKNRALSGYQIKRIDVSSISNSSVLLTCPVNSQGALKGIDILEIKLGQDNIKDKILILGGIIMQAKSEAPNIKYVDLRFKEPAIKLKDVKLKR